MNQFALKKIFIIFTSLIAYCCFTNAQPIPSPGTNAELCPSTNVGFTFDFGGIDPSHFTILTSTLKGCSIIANINGGAATVQFSDKKEVHQFEVYNTYSGYVAGTYTFTKIKTLDGIKGAFSVPLPIVPSGYDDIITDAVGLCMTGTFRYYSPAVKYKDAAGAEFGTTSMNIYEWVVPKGWKVFNIVSDGVTPITSSVFADITPDLLTTGEFKIRAKNNCDPNSLLSSTWFSVSLGRPVLKLISDKISINCGDQSPVNFSVQNGSLANCINSFTWNIGAGWLLSNGSTAPAIYSTGTASNLTLIPDCGQALGSVSATITTVNGDLPLNSNTVTITQPAMVIDGGSSLCTSSGSYSITPTLPCNASVSWQSSNQFIASITPNGSPATLTKAGIGLVTLTATITSCGVNLVKTIPVAVGSVAPGPIMVGPKTPWDIELYINPVPGATSYNWYKSGVMVANQHTTNVDIPVTCGVNYQISVEAISSCGTSSKTYIMAKANCSYPFFTISPNPATSELMVSSVQNNKTNAALNSKRHVTQIKIFDLQGRLKKYRMYNYGNQQPLNISDLPNGTYFIEVSNSERTEIQKIIIKK